MKRSLLIGATLLFALTAVGCSDDEEDAIRDGGDSGSTDSGAKDGGTTDATVPVGMDSGTDAGSDAGLDSSVLPKDSAVDATAPRPDGSTTTADAGGLDSGT